MSTAAKAFLSDAEDSLGEARDFLIASSRVLASRDGLTPTETAAVGRVIEHALDAIKNLEVAHATAFHATFGNHSANASIKGN